ncbi:hypothetical protein AGLY_001608 [Aphis glycines]|uniref:Uncharacterized protein n=1 Tax=Aphis glycines TaxID=307491 RepID=A0A6G0U741_APHGL|nr:hypothetical protein AGLY_001608 [Aphis glycines]
MLIILLFITVLSAEYLKPLKMMYFELQQQRRKKLLDNNLYNYLYGLNKLTHKYLPNIINNINSYIINNNNIYWQWNINNYTLNKVLTVYNSRDFPNINIRPGCRPIQFTTYNFIIQLFLLLLSSSGLINIITAINRQHFQFMETLKNLLETTLNIPKSANRFKNPLILRRFIFGIIDTMCSKPLRSRPTVEAKLSTFKLVFFPMYWQHEESKEQFSKLNLIKLEH